MQCGSGSATDSSMAAGEADQLIAHTRVLSLAVPRDHGGAASDRMAAVDDEAGGLGVENGGDVAMDNMAADAQPISMDHSHDYQDDASGWGGDEQDRGNGYRGRRHHDMSPSMDLIRTGPAPSDASSRRSQHKWHPPVSLELMPNEVLLHILGFLDVYDLLSTSRVDHLLRGLSLTPILHYYRLRQTRRILPPLLYSPTRPSLEELIARRIFLTDTSIISRRLARSFASIRLSRRLAARPSAEALVQRAVLPRECVPGLYPVYVAPGLVARRRAIERERLKDGLRNWVAAKWRREVREREEDVRRRDERRGVGRVWRLTRFWERVSQGDEHLAAGLVYM